MQSRDGQTDGIQRKIVVVGAGVIGLSVGFRLVQEGFDVTIIARDFPAPFETLSVEQIDYASAWAGAHCRFIPATNETEEHDHTMAVLTFRHMEKLVKEGKQGEAGIRFMRALEYVESPSQEYLDLTEEKAAELGYKSFHRLDKTELPANVGWGAEYQTFCLNPMMYCCFLLRNFTRLGGKIQKKTVQNALEVFDMAEFGDISAVINCSGFGFDDSAVIPNRGQFVIVANDCNVTITRQNQDGSWVVAIPRGYDGGTVVGGTREPGDPNPDPDPKTRERMLKNLKETHPQILPEGQDFKVIRDVVGRRPIREGGPRLECEEVAGNKALVHAYGLGGRGYECSWGVAETVKNLLDQHAQRTGLLTELTVEKGKLGGPL